MAYIYKIVNEVNGKVYIGKTNYTIQKRFKEHLHDRNRRKMQKRPLYAAMNKYGPENFTVHLVEEVPVQKASQREIYWIKYYNSYHNGYNATFGGDGKPYMDYKAISQKYKEIGNEIETAKCCNCCVDTVRYSCNLYGVEIKQRQNKRRAYYIKDGKQHQCQSVAQACREAFPDGNQEKLYKNVFTAIARKYKVHGVQFGYLD